MIKLMVLGAGVNQLPMITTATDYGLEVLAIDPDISAPGLAHATESRCFDLADVSTGIEVARSHNVSGVVTLGADFPMPMLAMICQELGLPGPGVEAVKKSTDKALMRRAFSTHGVCVLDFAEVEDENQAIEAMRSFGFPVILKPGISSGGRGICRIAPNAPTEDITAAFNEASAFSANRRVMIERFVQGPEYSVEMMTSHGGTSVIAITEKITTGAPYYVEIAHHQPASLSEMDRELLAKAAIGAVRACGIDNAPAHAEIRLTDEGPVIMEIAARLGGGFISSHLTPLSTGVDLLRATIDISLGRKPDLTARKSDGAAVAFLQPEPGRITSITGLDITQDDPFCVDAKVYKKVGDRIGRLRNATNRVGHVIVRGDTAAQARVHAKRLADQIHVATETHSDQGVII